MPEPSKIVKEARQRWLRCAEAEDAQRKRIILAKKFRSGDQWPEEIKVARQGGSALQGQAAQPPRPMLTIDRLSQPVRQVSNQIASSNFGLDVLPNGQGADAETAKIFKGIIRRMQNEARTTDPVGWAGTQAIEGGIGWFRLRSEYIEPVPGQQQDISLFDQELRFERISNNLSVYCDPSSILPTRRDAIFMFVTEDMPREEFKRIYPKADIASLDEFSAEGDQSKLKDWIGADTLRVAEYWRIVFEPRRFALLVDGSVQEFDEGKEPDKAQVKTTRTVQVPKVEGYKISATEQLESWDWLGARIPLFPVLGEELNIDGAQVLRGIIEEGMDAQRMVNYTYSGAVEIFALAPKAPWVLAEGQIEGYETIWQNANRFNYSHLPYKPVSLAGTPVPPPVRDMQEPPIQAAVMLMQKSEEGIRATTGLFEPSLGAVDPKQRSGRAILALQQQGELGSSNYLDAVQRAWLDVGAEILCIVPQITRKGQLLQILGIDDAPEQVLVGQPFQPGKNGAAPQPLNIPPELMNVQQGMAKFYDLAKGRYSVTVNVGKAYTTRKQEGASMLGDMLEKNPQLLQIFGDIFFRDLDFPGSEEVSERMKKMLPDQLKQDEGKNDPQKLMQAIQQSQTLIKHLTDELNAKNHIIETEQIKAQQEYATEQLKAKAGLDEKGVEADVKVRIAQIQADATIGSAQIKAGIVSLQEEMAAHREILQQIVGGGHDAMTQARDHAHEQTMQQAEHEHEQQLAQQDQAHQAGMAQQQQGHEQDLAAQQAEQQTEAQ